MAGCVGLAPYPLSPAGPSAQATADPEAYTPPTAEHVYVGKRRQRKYIKQPAFENTMAMWLGAWAGWGQGRRGMLIEEPSHMHSASMCAGAQHRCRVTVRAASHGGAPPLAAGAALPLCVWSAAQRANGAGVDRDCGCDSAGSVINAGIRRVAGARSFVLGAHRLCAEGDRCCLSEWGLVRCLAASWAVPGGFCCQH